MTDHDLLEQFERGTLPAEHFHHREHVRVAFLYLSKYSVLEALQKFCAALRKFAAAHGKPQLYHQTTTWAYVFLIGERMARAEHKLSWEDFARDNPDLLTWKNGLLQRYYREETLNSDLAKSNFILPDKRN
ncbi:MAG: hypothetical protein ACRD3H_10430 [Terriglobales bacterium]